MSNELKVNPNVGSPDPKNKDGVPAPLHPANGAAPAEDTKPKILVGPPDPKNTP